MRPLRSRQEGLHAGWTGFFRAQFLLWGVCAMGGGGFLSAGNAAPIDETKLPPAATNQIDFLRDIKPILDASCVKCHGPEKPRSHFRIDDRQALLKGGENGLDVVPGQ